MEKIVIFGILIGFGLALVGTILALDWGIKAQKKCQRDGVYDCSSYSPGIFLAFLCIFLELLAICLLGAVLIGINI